MRAFLDAMDDDPSSARTAGGDAAPRRPRHRRSPPADAAARGEKALGAHVPRPGGAHASSAGDPQVGRCSSSSRRSCSPTIPPRPRRARAALSPGTSTRRTTWTTSGGSASPTPTSRGAAPTRSWTRLNASGTTDAVVSRCQAHLDAGATQVAIQPLEQGDPFGRETLGRLAPVLCGRSWGARFVPASVTTHRNLLSSPLAASYDRATNCPARERRAPAASEGRLHAQVSGHHVAHRSRGRRRVRRSVGSRRGDVPRGGRCRTGGCRGRRRCSARGPTGRSTAVTCERARAPSTSRERPGGSPSASSSISTAGISSPRAGRRRGPRPRRRHRRARRVVRARRPAPSRPAAAS